MANVDIYLPIQPSGSEWIHALSIPREDIDRLTRRPLKWLRFATFTVCGNKGHLSTTKGGEMVDYENVSLGDLADRYYYILDSPENPYRLVDYNAFNDKCTSSAVTERASWFRREVCARDDRCVITQGPNVNAAHIIPRSKGSNYITFVVRARSTLYERLPFSPEDGVDIDCAENGMLLRKDLHDKFGKAELVFLKTPNFAMVPADVPRVEAGPIPDNRTTLQYMKSTTERAAALPWDVQVDWSRDEVRPPPSILLDFMYGAAVVKYWKCTDMRDMLEKTFKEDFRPVLDKPPERANSDDDEFEEPDDPNEPDWEHLDASAGLLEAMDDMILLSMLLKGTTPRSMAAEWEERQKEEELRSQEQACEKVQRWLDIQPYSQEQY